MLLLRAATAREGLQQGNGEAQSTGVSLMGMQQLSETLSPNSERMLAINLQRLRDPAVLAEAARWRESELLASRGDSPTEAKEAPTIARSPRKAQGKESITTEVIT